MLEALLEHELAGGATPEVTTAREAGEEYLLRRRLTRGLRDGEPVDPEYLRLTHPSRWRYDVLRGSDHFRRVGTSLGRPPDPRLEEAAAYVASRQRPDGRWELDRVLRGRQWSDYGEVEGQPSRWVTLRAMRVLRWWEGG